ncbi:GATA zinc finger domain-containing protein 14-like isoform X2 [Bradysia coprophila]|uniref:GATA zinc finger domain-containing protein 14-like isoform X2 n=1 Tax=Bradysia coprophila TaxID=38358 RepID=UPI00187DC945|nr:GATA zinc finger domain-containing protein 14-like isoform X2 [Bradysia coprophila]XP_037036515.1 GATA zinc finger domain-containing protein 14-like isoform X2 [Bradysia coprophila]XP_037036516.1 GATA zinc finger domain-containing protein 14-like isoform X2 [Bradysia coprophila]
MNSQNSDIDTVGCADSQARAIIVTKSTNNQIVPSTKRKQNLPLAHQMKSASTTDLTVASVPNKITGTPTKSTNLSTNHVTHSKSQHINTVRQMSRAVMPRGQNNGRTEPGDDQSLSYQNYQCYPASVPYSTSSVTVPISMSSPHIGTVHSNYHSQYHSYSNQLQIQQPNAKHNDIGNRPNYSHRQNGSNKKMYNSNYTKSKRNGNYNNNNHNTNTSSDKTYNSSTTTTTNNNNNYSKNNNITNNNNNNNEYQRNMANMSGGQANNQPITRSGHRSFNSDTSQNISPSRDHYSSSSSSSSSSSVPLNKKRDSRTTPTTAYAHERDVSYISRPWPQHQYMESVQNPIFSYDWLRTDGYYPAGRLPHQQHITYSDPSTGEFITVTNVLDGKRVNKTNRVNPKNGTNTGIKRYTPPDRFMNRAPHVEIKETPQNLTNGTRWDRLSIQVWDKFLLCQQKEGTYMKKIKMWKNMYCSVQESFSDYSLYMVGSTISGFGSDVSDVDMCLVDSTKNSQVYFGNDLRIHSAKILNDFKELLSRNAIYGEFNLILAKVPILRFKDTFHEFEIDLNYNNYVGVQNTHLMYCYGRMDWRLRPLALVVKIWAQYHGINNAKEMTISSYSLVLMVIHFLQCAVSPPVLPCLHDLYPSKFQKQQEIKSIDMHEDLAPWFSQNKQSLGELFFQFFDYYTNFDFSTKAISVRKGCTIPIESCKTNNSPKNDPNQWKELCIEEPFDFTNTAHSCYDPHKFQWVRRVFTMSYEALYTTRDLKSILSL